MEGVGIGRIVHFVLDQPAHDEVRPGIIVRLFEPMGGNEGVCNLQVFTDEANDRLPGIIWVTSVKYSAEPEARTWHWPPRI